MSSEKKDKKDKKATDKKEKKEPADKKEKISKSEFTSGDKLEAIYASLDANKYTSLSFKTKFATDTTKLFKHAKKATSLSALELIGVGTTAMNTKEILQLAETSHTLTYLRLSDHCLDPQALARINHNIYLI
jgi:hypothetical protein